MFTIKQIKLLKVFLEQKIPPQKDDKIVSLDSIDIDKYNLLVLPGGVKSMELLRLDQKAIDVVKSFNEKKN